MLGPWNSPPNFLGAMSSGASAGLQARGQDIAQSEAADRLSLAYNQLAAEEAARSEAAQQRLQLANNANLLKAQQMNMMEQWRQSQVAQQAAAADALDKYRTGQLQLGRDRLNKPAVMTPYQSAEIELRKAAQDNKFTNVGPTIERINKLTEELKPPAEPDKELGPEDPGFGPLADEKRAQLAILRNQLQRAYRQGGPRVVPGSPGSPGGGTGSDSEDPSTPAATPTITSKDQYDQIPSGTIYLGKNGKKYRKP